MRVCLYGGSFDPPHNGHLAIAEQCRQTYSIDRVIFVPAFLAPHKTNLKISSVKDRLAMLRLAIQAFPRFEISEYELDRKGISYSIDTVLEFKKRLNLMRDNLFFLIGADSITEFKTWREPHRILDECRVIVAARPPYLLNDVPLEFRNRVEILSNPLMDISSTEIRDKIRNNRPVQHLIPVQVLDYIHRNKLYRN